MRNPQSWDGCVGLQRTDEAGQVESSADYSCYSQSTMPVLESSCPVRTFCSCFSYSHLLCCNPGGVRSSEKGGVKAQREETDYSPFLGCKFPNLEMVKKWGKVQSFDY